MLLMLAIGQTGTSLIDGIVKVYFRRSQTNLAEVVARCVWWFLFFSSFFGSSLFSASLLMEAASVTMLSEF